MNGAPASAPPRASFATPIGHLRLAFLLLRAQLLSFWHRLGVHGRAGWLVPLLALVTPLSYVGLMSQALVELRARATPSAPDVDQLAVTLMAGVILLASFTNRLASGLSLLATVPENELLLSRPVPLSRLAVARVLSSTVADPVGALFLLPLWTAPILVWRLSVGAFGLCALVSVLLQVTITASAQVSDLALARYIPARQRARLAVALRVVAVAALAMLWIAGTQVLRMPEGFVQRAPVLRPWLSHGPAHWPTAALFAWREDALGGVLVAVGGLFLLAGAALVATAITAGLVSRQGWEEPAPVWTATPPRGEGPPLTPWRRELRLLMRDRSRLVLVFLVPAAFIAVPLLSSQGWAWTSASPSRLAILVFSMLVYLAASGPLLHMQGEQRAFWILQTVPVSLSRLFALKAAVWSTLFVLIASAAFLILVWAAGSPLSWRLVGSACLLLGGSVGLAFLAVGLGATAVDFTEAARPALGPTAFYAFLFVAALYNVSLADDGGVAVRGSALFAVATAAIWHSGLERARWAYDPDEVKRRHPRASDAALVTMVAFFAPIAATRLPAGVASSFGMASDGLVLLLSVRLLWRWRASRSAAAPAWVAAGLAGGIALPLLWPAAGVAMDPVAGGGLFDLGRGALLLGVAAKELCLRGVAQSAAEHTLARLLPPRMRPAVPALLAAAVVVLLELLVSPDLSGVGLLMGVVATVLRAASGRAGAALAFRLGGVAASVWG